MLNVPASWYIVAESEQISSRKPLEIDLFGVQLVAWRGPDGKPALTARSCTHMGANLAKGRVVAGCIECPFHGWRFDGSGRCIRAPRVERIPQTAALAALPTVERYGYVWAWYGSPRPLFGLPEFPPAEADAGRYMEIRSSFRAETSTRRVLENIFDAQHLLTVHGFESAEFVSSRAGYGDAPSADECGPSREARFEVMAEVVPPNKLGEALGMRPGKFLMTIRSWPTGHVVLVSPDSSTSPETVSIHGVTPVSDVECIGWTLLLIPRTGRLGRDIFNRVVVELGNFITVREDIPMWKGITDDSGGAFSKLDRVVLDFRKFYQEWVDVAHGKVARAEQGAQT